MRGDTATTSLGHSRGTLVQTNANRILAEQGHTNPNLTVQGVGGALGAEEYVAAAENVIGDKNLAKAQVTYSYFSNDPVPVVTGGNSGVLSVAEFWRVLTTNNSAHSCYGTGAAGCDQVQYLASDAPAGAKQDNSRLIQYIGGQPYDGNMNPSCVSFFL